MGHYVFVRAMLLVADSAFNIFNSSNLANSKALKRNKVCEVEQEMWKRNEITEKSIQKPCVFGARPSKTAVRSQKLLPGLGSKCEVDIGCRGFEEW